MSTTVSATQGSVAVGSIQVGGDVHGDIIIGNHNFKVNTNYGTIVYHAAAEPVITRREAQPQPPRAPLEFFDRTGELAQVETLITQGKPVAICGSDGAGKSALLRQAANGSAAHTLPDGAILLEGLDEQGHTLLPGDVIQRWFDAFYLSEPPLKVTSASAQPYLSQLRPLVLLDNIALDADQLRPLLDLFPNSPALIARPSALPGLARPIKLGPLPRADAIELFAATSGLLIDDANRSSADAICALVNDVPLAIVRAADVIREMNLPLDQAQKRLEATPSAVGDTIAIGLSRAAVLIQSVLTPLEKQVLGVAANLPGISIDPQKIAALIEGAQADAVEAAIEHLKTLGLLHANSPRVRLDAGLREFWRGKDGTAINDRLLAQLLRDQKDGRFADDEFCADELGHVLGAIDYAAQTKQWGAAITLSRAIDRYVTLHGLWDAWGQIADRVLQSARAENDRSAEAWALHQLGTRAIGSNKTQAIDLLKQALSVRQAIGETTAAAYTQHNLDMLIPPLIPPKGGEGSVGPAGMSGVLKIIIGVIIVGLLGGAAIVVAQLASPAPTPTSIVVVVPPNTPTHLPAHTPTLIPPTHTATHISSLTPTGTPPPTKTFTPTPTATATPTPAAVLPVVAERNGRYEVVVTDGDGQQQTPLTEDLKNGAYDPALSPDGQSIAFWSFINDTAIPTQRDLYVMNLIDRKPRLLLSASPLDSSRIVWSPLSDRMAVTLVDQETRETDIYLVPIDGGDPQRLTSPRLDDFPVHTDPAFSPDGSEIAFVPRNENLSGLSIAIKRVDGEKYRRIFGENNRSINVQQLAWQPGGDRLSFVAVPAGTAFSTALPRPQLALINSDGSDVRVVTDSQFARFDNSAWSPSGKQLAFIAENTVWVMAADGSNLRPIVRSVRADPNNTCTFEAVLGWLPQGDRIAYNTDRSGPTEVHTISLDGRTDRRLPLDPLSYLRLPRGCPIF